MKDEKMQTTQTTKMLMILIFVKYLGKHRMNVVFYVYILHQTVVQKKKEHIFGTQFKCLIKKKDEK